MEPQTIPLPGSLKRIKNMKQLRIILPLVITCILFGCSQNNKGDNRDDTETKIPFCSADKLSVDPEYTSRIDKLKASSSKREIEFIDDLLSTITKFNDLPIDTTIITLANIDAVEPLDTVLTRVFVKNDTVHLKSSWFRKGELLWHTEIKDPYLWVSDNVEFDSGTRSIWVTLTIAIQYSLPRFYYRSEFPQISNETVITMGKAYLDSKGISSLGLPGYLADFGGQLLEYGEPELREGLFIWHEPSKQFISYYRP